MMDTLPQGWEGTTLSEVITPSKQKIDPLTVPDSNYLSLEHIESGSNKILSVGKASDVKSTKSVFKAGDVLYGKLRPYLKKVCVPDFDGVCSTDIFVLEQSGNHNSRFFLHLLSQDTFADYANVNSKGINLPRLGPKQFGDYEVNLPPLNEQHRIVEKIDALMARSGAAKEALDAIPTLLDQYRQSVLAAAFRGDLTKGWREKNPDTEPAENLLDRIRLMRRQRWEETELAKLRAKGKEPENDKWKSKYKEPAELETDGLHNLPQGWIWTTIDQLSYIAQYGSSSKTNDDVMGVPVLRMGNIHNGQLRLHDLKYLPNDHTEFPDLLLDDGDVIFNRTNSPELVGKTAVYRSEYDSCSFASYLIRLKSVGILPELMAAYINSPFGRNWVSSVVSQQVGQANVNGTKLKALRIPLPPQAEQEEIAKKIKNGVEMIQIVAESFKENSDRMEKLNQSILSKAFRGELVPQDPTDEPASVLLERIRTERAALAPVKKSGRKKSG